MIEKEEVNNPLPINQIGRFFGELGTAWNHKRREMLRYSEPAHGVRESRAVLPGLLLWRF